MNRHKKAQHCWAFSLIIIEFKLLEVEFLDHDSEWLQLNLVQIEL